MGSNTAGEGESSFEIAAELIDLLDVGDQFFINSLLDCFGLGPPSSGCLFSLLSSGLSSLRGIFKLVFSVSSLRLEVGFVDVGSNSIKWNFGGSGNNVGWVYSFKRDTVDGIWTSNEDIA